MKLRYLISIVIIGLSVLVGGLNATEQYTHEQSLLSGQAHTSSLNEEMITSEGLRSYFLRLVQSKEVHQRDIAEALFVSPSTISEFIRYGRYTDYVMSQYALYKNSHLSLSDQKKQSNEISVSNYEEISFCLQRALELSIMPDELRKNRTLKTYFKGLLKGDLKRINVCAKTLHLDDKLNLFLASEEPDSNLTSTVYSHLVSYYRGTKLILRDQFHPLEDVLNECDQKPRSFLNLMWKKWIRGPKSSQSPSKEFTVAGAHSKKE